MASADPVVNGLNQIPVRTARHGAGAGFGRIVLLSAGADRFLEVFAALAVGKLPQISAAEVARQERVCGWIGRWCM